MTYKSNSIITSEIQVKKRKNISKKIRFEVFKRDSFTCQYCGAKAPDAVLECDHIQPVAEGGTNDLINLVTSCYACNRGKGKRLLDNNKTLEAQHNQIKENSARLEQLKLLKQWHDESINIQDQEVDICVDIIEHHAGINVTDIGKASLRKIIKSFGLDLTIKAINGSMETYFKNDLDSARKAFNKIGAVANVMKRGNSEYTAKAAYAAGILRNRGIHRPSDIIQLITTKAKDNVEIYDSIIEIAKTAKNWTIFKEEAGL